MASTKTKTPTNVTTAKAIESFAKTVKENSAKKVGDSTDLLKKIAAVKTTNPTIYDEGRLKEFLKLRAKTLETLLDNYMVARLSEKYPLIDESLFGRKRYLVIKDKKIVEDVTVKEFRGDGNNISANLFVLAEVGEVKSVNIASYRVVTNQHYFGYTETVTITCKVPEVPQSVMVGGHKAKGFLYSILTDLCNDATTSGIVDIVDTQPEYYVAWIPTAKSLNVKVDIQKVPAPRHYDPALLMKYRDRYYLVGLWDVVDEKPIEDILREFTVGPAKFPKKAT